MAVAGVGLLCVVAALILMGSDDHGTSPGPLKVTIADELGPGQVSEEITVFLDGRHVGVIKIDQQSPKAQLPLTVAKAGRYDYRLEAKRQLKGKQPVAVSSKGDVVIDGRGHLGIYADPTGKTYLVAIR
jgi:hypothetical protein